jgi:isopenicillin-N N-acyltransferase-like protein
MIEEMRGIAEGAQVDFEAVVLLNARTELLREAREVRDAARTGESAAPDGCTGVVIMPSAARDGRLIHALNWDWKAECAETSIVMLLRRENGPDVLTFAEAGALSRAGVNSAGIAITANYIESDRDFEGPGIPLALVRRKVLEAETYAGAIGVIVSTDKVTSNNLILSHRDGVAIDFECAPRETFALYPSGGLLVHAITGPARLGFRNIATSESATRLTASIATTVCAACWSPESDRSPMKMSWRLCVTSSARPGRSAVPPCKAAWAV